MQIVNMILTKRYTKIVEACHVLSAISVLTQVLCAIYRNHMALDREPDELKLIKLKIPLGRWLSCRLIESSSFKTVSQVRALFWSCNFADVPSYVLHSAESSICNIPNPQSSSESD
jgi:hypothetical protein